ncbi:MAG: glycosyltransferase family 39 protein [Chloroflexi bacterium]|nr:glycosyltransferase family 39 protein [Chloroflexota bacterium]
MSSLRRANLAALGLTWLALALRLYRLTFQSLWRDEVDTLLFATRPLTTVLGNFSKPGENGPLFFLAMRPWLTVAGRTEFALRFPSALAGAMAVPVIYLLVRRLGGVRPALVAGLLAAVAPYLVWYGQEAKMYAALTVLVPLSLWLTLQAIERGGWRWWVSLYVVTSLSWYTHVLAALVVVVQAAWFVTILVFEARAASGKSPTQRAAEAAPRHRLYFRPPPVADMGVRTAGTQGARRWLAPALYLAGLILPYLPLAWWQAKLWLSPTFETGHPFVSLPDVWLVLAEAFGRGIMPGYEPISLLPFILAWLAGAVLWPAIRDTRRDWRTAALLATWLLLPPLALFGVSLGMPIFADRYLIWVMPAFLALVALGLVGIARVWRPLGLLTAGAILAVYLAGVWQQAHVPIKADFRSAASFVAAHQQTDDLLLFQIPYIRQNYRYYSDRFDSSVGRLRGIDGPYTNDGLDEPTVAETLANGVAQASAVWLIASEAPMWDTRGLTQAWLSAHGAVTDQAEFARVAVTRYELRK